LSSIFGKIFDIIFIHKHYDELSTSELQFGLKKRSTNQCSMMLKETIAYYVQQDGMTYCTVHDATKAFDRVQYCKLFRLLVDRKLSAVWVCLLAKMYTNSCTRIALNGICSGIFFICNGFKQGGVLSPILFCVYLNGLLKLLSDAKVGCFVGTTFVGVLAYADDLVLLAPTAGAVRRMLSVCDR
jgi:Reverse transcriptase (RNA-dependent DNA polymerase)